MNKDLPSLYKRTPTGQGQLSCSWHHYAFVACSSPATEIPLIVHPTPPRLSPPTSEEKEQLEIDEASPVQAKEKDAEGASAIDEKKPLRKLHLHLPLE